MNEKNPPRKGVQSVEVGVRLLEALSRSPGAMALKDVAAAAGMPASKAHRYLVSFVRVHLVEQDRVSGRYDLGRMALQMGLSALGRLDVIRLASRTLPDLVARINESAFLAVWGNRGPTIVRWEECARPVTVNVRVGSVLPLLTSATGRVFAAYLPEPLTRERIAAEMKDESRLDVDRLVREVHRRGLGRVDGDLLPGVSALSAPIFDHTGKLAAVITTLGAEGEFDSSWDGPIARELRAVTRALSARLGHAA